MTFSKTGPPGEHSIIFFIFYFTYKGEMPWNNYRMAGRMHDLLLLLNCKPQPIFYQLTEVLCNSKAQSETLCFCFTVKTTILVRKKKEKRPRGVRGHEDVLVEITQTYALQIRNMLWIQQAAQLLLLMLLLCSTIGVRTDSSHGLECKLEYNVNIY